MSGNKAVFDSNIIIYLSKGALDIDKIFKKFDKHYISIITYMEVMGFQFLNQEEKKIVKSLLNTFEMLNINPEIAEIVIEIREKKKIKLPDAIIAATARYRGAVLLTRNVKDFLNTLDSTEIEDPFEYPG